MLNTARRFVIANAAVCFAACPDVGSDAIGRETSPRIMRLREIFARVIEINHALATSPASRRERGLRAELEGLADEVQGITDRVWASPVQGATDVLERAIVTFYGQQKGAEPQRQAA